MMPSAKVYPQPILKKKKSVTWGVAETQYFRNDEWLAVPLLNEVTVSRKVHQIKAAPVVKPTTRTAPRPMVVARPVPKPNWTFWQKVARGHYLAHAFPYVFVGSVLAIAMGGPVGCILPVGYLVLCIGALVYRRLGPTAETVAREKVQSDVLRQRYLRKARIAQAEGQYQQAYSYERLANKLK